MKIILVLMVLMFASPVFAHSGGTDAAGCHYDHRTGVYHCH